MPGVIVGSGAVSLAWCRLLGAGREHKPGQHRADCNAYKLITADNALMIQSKYTTTLRDHSSTMSHMQKELESLRQSEKALRTRLRDMELDNDDLEKSER